MSAAQPWMKFFPQDWRADEKLRMCSLAARGLWMEMLAIMHRSERYGHLIVSGRAPTDTQLAVLVGATPDEVTALLADLESAGVFSRNAGGVIYSRRMTRDEKKAKTARKNGRAGGNPNLSKQRGNRASVNPQDNPPDKGGVKAQRPEARGQRPERREDSSGQSNPRADPFDRAACDPEFEGQVRRIAQAIGLTRPASQMDRAQLQAWLRDGIDVEFHVLEAAGAVAAREHGKGKAVSGFRYLDGAVREYAAEWHADRDRYREIAGGGR